MKKKFPVPTPEVDLKTKVPKPSIKTGIPTKKMPMIKPKKK